MSIFLSPQEKTIVTPRRVIRRPDFRNLIVPRLSGELLVKNEVDYDDLVIHRTWRAYHESRPNEVKYFMFELSQKNPGEKEFSQTFYKAMRMIRLTRVPRYLRQASASSGPNMVFEQMRDVLAALREQGVLFTHLMAKSAQTPLIFAYGVQGVGSTREEAMALADEGHAVMTYQLNGTYQQLKYSAISLEEGELLARYQSEWSHLAMGRGRPLPTGGSVGSSSLLDGNRTDVESINNQLESFLRGMSDKEFMLSLVTVPLSPAEITVAWRNITQKLSEVRSDVQGQRSVNAGVAFPLAMSHGDGYSHGSTHTSGTGAAASTSDGTSSAVSQGLSTTQSQGVNASVAGAQQTGVSQSITDSASQSISQGQTFTEGNSISQGQSLTAGDTISAGQSLSAGQSASQGDSLSLGDSYSQSNSLSHGSSASLGDSVSQSLGATHTQGESYSASQGTSQGVSSGESVGLTRSEGLSQAQAVNQGQSLSLGQSVGQNWANSVGQSMNGGVTSTQGWSESAANALSQAISNSATNGNTLTGGSSSGTNAGLSGQLPLIGLGGSNGTSLGESLQAALSNSNTFGLSQTGSSTHTAGVSNSMANSLTQGVNLGESFGGSLGQSSTATGSVGSSQSVGTNSGLSASQAQSVSQSQGLSQSVGQGVSLSDAMSQSVAQGQTFAQGVNQTLGQGVSQGQSLSQGINQGSGQSLSQGANMGTSQSLSQGVTQGVGQSVSQANSQTAGQSLGRSVGMGESQSFTQSASQGTSQTAAQGQSVSQSDGTSKGVAANQSLTDAYAVAAGRSNMNTGSLAVAPSFGVSVSRATFDEAKRVIGDVLEAQMRRYIEGIKSGAFLYQMFLVCPDRDTLLGGAGLLKSAFWGAGQSGDQLPEAFHTITEFEDDERARLLTHAAAFTSYRKREPESAYIQPFVYSSFLTPSEAAAFVHPPVTEGPGLLAVHDSMPVMAMPANRGNREIQLGRVVNGERAEISALGFGLDLSEMAHTGIFGVTGSGKTTTLMKFLSEAVNIERQVITPGGPGVMPKVKKVKASILGLDWMRSMRDLGSIPELVESERFHFYSLVRPELGAFRWNVLEVPASGMAAVEWLNAQADNFTASFNLGEFGRSLIAEFLSDLYGANRLEDFILRREVLNEDTGEVLRPAVILPKLDPGTLPEGAIQIGPDAKAVANAFTCAELSRCVSMAHLATLVAAKVEEMADPTAARLYGTSMRDRLQSLWRRMQYFAPGGQYNDLLGCDPDLTARTTLGVNDLIDPDKGLVTVLETDGLDMESRRLILGSVMLALYRYGLHHGEGVFDHDGMGPGAFVVMEESHELFGESDKNEDAFSASTRTALYESMFRRVRQLGMRLIAVAQEPASLPDSVTANINNVFIHKVRAKDDRDKAFAMLNWNNQVGQQQREWRYLGEMPTGYCIARLDAREDYLESAPVQFRTDPPVLEKVSDTFLRDLAQKH